MSKIVALTATTFGVGWTQSVLLPVFCSAAGCTALDLAPSGTTSAGGGISGGGGSGPLQEFVEQLGPQTPAAALIARTCVLPHVLCSVLPYAGPTAVSDWLLALTRVTHQDAPPSYQQLSPFFALYQAPGTPSHPQWLVLAQQQLAAAVGYACSTNSVVVSQVLQVLEHLAHSQPVPSSKGAAPVKLSGLTGALSLTLAQGLLPLMGSTPTSSTHSTTSITHHTSNAQTAAFPTTASGLEIGPAYMPAVPSSTPASTATAARPDSSNLNSNLKRGDVELPPMPLDSRGSLGSGYGSPAATPAPPLPPSGAGLAKKVMSLLMVMLSEGDQEVQCGVVLVLLEVLMRYRGGAGEDAKLVEQVCVVYDGLLASGSPPLVSSVLGAAQHLAVATAPTAARSAAAAQLLEWVLQSVLALASQLVPPPAGTAPLAPGAYDHQRHQAVQLLSVTHAAFMQDVQLPRLNTALQGCLKALASIRTLLPEPYAAVLTPMLANNRPAAGTAMANALSAAAAMSAIAAPPAVTVAQGLPAWAAAAAPPAYNQAAPATPAAAQQHPNLSPQQQQYLQSQRQQQAALAPTAGQYGAGQYGHHGSGTPPLAPPSAQPAVAPPVDNLSTRFEKLKSRFRKKADGEDGTAPA